MATPALLTTVLSLSIAALAGCALDDHDTDDTLSADDAELTSNLGLTIIKNQATGTCLKIGAGTTLALAACNTADVQQRATLLKQELFKYGGAYHIASRLGLGSAGQCVSPTTAATVTCATLPARVGYFEGGMFGTSVGRLRGVSEAGPSTQCIAAVAGRIVLAPCDNSAAQQWAQQAVFTRTVFY
jgi:Cytolethal distending toxin A/C domain